ncbi:unnamed protein product [Discosporangium mesarthrocarpum]
MKDEAKIYPRPDEEFPNPPRSPSKRFISKVMFLVAAARPRQLSKWAWLDGKVGIWPVIETLKENAAARTVPLVTLNQPCHHGQGTAQADDDRESSPSCQGKGARIIYMHHLGPAGQRQAAHQQRGYCGH